MIILSVVYVKVFADDPALSSSKCSEALKKKFQEWKAKFNVSYSSSAEEEKRREIFCENRKKVSDHNQQNNSSYTRSENAHTDKSKQEKDENMLGAKRTESPKSNLDTTQKVAKTRAPFTTKIRSTLRAMPPAPSVKTTTQKPTTQKLTTQKPTTQKPSTVKTTTKATTKTISKISSSTSRITTTSTLSSTAQSNTVDTLSYFVKSGTMPDNLNYTSDCSPIKDQYGCGSCWVIFIKKKCIKNLK